MELNYSSSRCYGTNNNSSSSSRRSSRRRRRRRRRRRWAFGRRPCLFCTSALVADSRLKVAPIIMVEFVGLLTRENRLHVEPGQCGRLVMECDGTAAHLAETESVISVFLCLYTDLSL